MRLVRFFTLIALIPTVLVAVFATITLNFGLEGWFSDRVRDVVANSLAAAQAYQEEHRVTLQTDARVLGGFLNDQKERYPLLSGGQLREMLGRAVSALSGLADVAAQLVSGERLEPADRYHAFLVVLDRDARDSLAALQLVQAQAAISSQLIDNLNASIHVRALLTDLFLVDEILKGQSSGL